MCSPARTWRPASAGRPVPAHQASTRRAFVGAQVQAELAAPPQHVVGAARPFLVAAGSASSASCRPGATSAPRSLAARASPSNWRRGCRRRAPAAAPAAPAARDGAAPGRRTKRSKSVSGRCAGPIQAAQVAAGQERAVGPRRAGVRRAAAPTRSAASSASLRKVVILPPQTASSGAAAASSLEQVVARDRRRVARGVVEQRAHAGVAPDHVGRRHRRARSSGWPARTGSRSRCGVDARRGRVALDLDVGGADQREVALVGDGEDDALVGVLEDVGVVVRRSSCGTTMWLPLTRRRLRGPGPRRLPARDAAQELRSAQGPAALTRARALQRARCRRRPGAASPVQRRRLRAARRRSGCASARWRRARARRSR